MKKVSLYANIDYSCYIISNQPNNEPALFQEDTHNYYNGGFTGAYYTSLFHRPLILSTIVSVDAWEKGWGKLQAKMAAMTVLKQSERTKFSVGFFGMSLYHSVSIFPVIAFWYRFSNPNWSLDLTPPSTNVSEVSNEFPPCINRNNKGNRQFLCSNITCRRPISLLFLRSCDETRGSIRIHHQSPFLPNGPYWFINGVEECPL